MRPIVAALEALDFNPEKDEDSGPEPDDMKVILEDALAVLGNAVFICMSCRNSDKFKIYPNRASQFLTSYVYIAAIIIQILYII